MIDCLLNHNTRGEEKDTLLEWIYFKSCGTVGQDSK